MKRILYSLALLSLLALAPLASADTNADTGPVIALRAFFTAVVKDDAGASWVLFTRRTQDGVVKSVADSEHMDPAAVRRLFDTADLSIRDGFWKSFHQSSQAESFIGVQMSSQGPANGADGSVLITMPNGNQATVLMFREGGAWKVGWFETFFPNGLTVPSQ